MIEMRNFKIENPSDGMRSAIQDKIDNLNKPKGSLGVLEVLAMQVCLVQQTLTPSLANPCHLLLGGDHGIEREGVSVSPREVTWQQMINFTKGGGGVNMFCRQHGFKLRVVDVGVDYDLSQVPGIIDHKIARGTKNFLYEPAMSEEEFDKAIEIGASLVDDCIADGCKVLCIGEMGIANTSPSSIWMSLFCDIPLDECIGAGAGLDSPGIRHKREVLRQAVAQWKTKTAEPDSSLGFIMTACALAACRLCPEAQGYMVFGHCGDESGHRRMLDAMGAKPLLSLGLRLGEGTGALCAFPILDSAVRMINEMNNFDNGKITKYF